MSNVLIEESNLENIADAIRTKLRTEDTFYPSQMAAAIGEISVIDIDPTLTQSGQAADAKVTGDRIRETEAFIHSMIDDTLSIYGKAADARIAGQRINSVESDLSTLTRRHNELSYDEMLIASEVEDARIGTDGTQYANAGEAVRSQVSGLQNSLQNVEDAVRHYTFTDSGGGQIVITEGGME